jgi:c-di-GMP-binding flagellar brake protein YcgR
MRLDRFWKGVRTLLDAAPEPQASALPVCELAVAQPARVRDVLEQLADAGLPLALQSAFGEPFARATLVAVGTEALTLRLERHDGLLSGTAPLRVNVVGSSPGGALMFSLVLKRTHNTGLWQAPLPFELLCIQSRQHRRVEVGLGRSHQAAIELDQQPQRRDLHDLSEHGASLTLPDTAALDAGGGVLLLDGVAVRVPEFRVASVGAAVAGGVRIGLGLHGIDPMDQRALRRWLNQAETALAAFDATHASRSRPPSLPDA